MSIIVRISKQIVIAQTGISLFRYAVRIVEFDVDRERSALFQCYGHSMILGVDLNTVK